jgi:redox-sensitive bicupin YhaK (pirin superfamily)
MIAIRKADERGHADHGWLNTYHSFSFADYFDPEHTQFRSLRVLNEDRVAAGMGFGSHPHRDMEIISYVVSGALEHKDNLGTKATMRAGDVQRISAGTGVIHSEYNPSSEDPAHFLQIWILPDERGAAPRYTEKAFGNITPGKLHLIASKSGRDESIPIYQDAEVSVARLDTGGSFDYPLKSGRSGWVQLIEGELDLNGTMLRPGDGAAIQNESLLHLQTPSNAHFLFFDLN